MPVQSPARITFGNDLAAFHASTLADWTNKWSLFSNADQNILPRNVKTTSIEDGEDHANSAKSGRSHAIPRRSRVGARRRRAGRRQEALLRRRHGPQQPTRPSGAVLRAGQSVQAQGGGRLAYSRA